MAVGSLQGCRSAVGGQHAAGRRFAFAHPPTIMVFGTHGRRGTGGN